MFDQEKMLADKEGENRIRCARFLDLCERVLHRHDPEYTDFMDPHQRKLCLEMLVGIPDLEAREYGGYRKAERKRICLYPDYYFTDLLESGLSFVEISLPDQAPDLSHRNYLGAILGLGIKRKKIGDLWPVENGCQVVLACEILDFILTHLREVDRYPVEVFEIESEALTPGSEPSRSYTSTVASMRLDAVASAGFGVSRNQMKKFIKQGRVSLNWQVTEDPAADVEPDDVISVRGRGRVEIGELCGKSNRGRFKLRLERYT